MKQSSKILVVDQRYRTNRLSHLPGGSSVTSIMQDGSHLEYQNIKNPDAYIRKAAEDPAIVAFLVNGKPYSIN
jgi:hypothetical protein